MREGVEVGPDSGSGGCHDDTLSSFLLCSAEGGTEEEVSGGVSSSVSQLKSRIRQLECDLESRDEENRRRIRALQQKYSKMEVCVCVCV